ncbi:transcriptional regulator with XRE-family HTH domain [Phyllobacterium myrsinacearum]|nr:transcriptional regulator with XRE-family HTH domain [Phyllobacterium myrsinacearum]RZU97267.1 transcriptional regulator with XRE-family HTH domain [Phyllobacterium myrsinacearum]
MRAVMGPQSRFAIVAAAMAEGSRMKPVDRLPVRCRKGKVKAGAGHVPAFRLMLDRQLVAAARRAITDRLIRFAGSQIFPDPDISKRGERRIVKGRRAPDIGNAEGEVMEHVHGGGLRRSLIGCDEMLSAHPLGHKRRQHLEYRQDTRLTYFHYRDNFSYMENISIDTGSMDQRIARRLKGLRVEREWSLDELARRSMVSRATLSRLENAEVSPTAQVLGKLCSAYGLTMSRLMHMVEDEFAPLIRRDAQAVWIDPSVGFRRRSVSPPAQTLAGEMLECELDPGARISYDNPPRPGLEHYLLLIDGQLEVSVDGQAHALNPGDCLRYQLFGPSTFATSEHSGARYVLFML